MKKREFTIDGVTVLAHRWVTAVRRVRGYKRGEFDIDGATILAKDRTPPGKSMRRKKRKNN